MVNDWQAGACLGRQEFCQNALPATFGERILASLPVSLDLRLKS
jgi:hypothetical protein